MYINEGTLQGVLFLMGGIKIFKLINKFFKKEEEQQPYKILVIPRAVDISEHIEEQEELKRKIDDWHKQNSSPLINNNYLPDTEYVVFAREKGVKLYGNYFTKHKYFILGVNQIDKKKYGHPTIKNLNFIENHIINSSKEGDVVLDCW